MNDIRKIIISLLIFWITVLILFFCTPALTQTFDFDIEFDSGITQVFRPGVECSVIAGRVLNQGEPMPGVRVRVSFVWTYLKAEPGMMNEGSSGVDMWTDDFGHFEFCGGNPDFEIHPNTISLWLQVDAYDYSDVWAGGWNDRLILDNVVREWTDQEIPSSTGESVNEFGLTETLPEDTIVEDTTVPVPGQYDPHTFIEGAFIGVPFPPSCPGPLLMVDSTAAESWIMGDPVFAHNGEFVRSELDLAILVGKGPPFMFFRTNRSQTVTDGVFGKGWKHNLEFSVLKGANNADGVPDVLRLASGSGRADSFQYNPIASTSPLYRYDPPMGFLSTITLDTNSTAELDDDTFTLKNSDDNTQTYNHLGLLVEIADRWGNGLTIDRDPGMGHRVSQVKDALGNSIQFNYDPNTGRLASIKDWSDRTVVYTYYRAGEPGGTTGQLRSVSMIPTGGSVDTSPTVVYTYVSNARDYLETRGYDWDTANWRKDFLEGALISVTAPDQVDEIRNSIGLPLDSSFTNDRVTALLTGAKIVNKYDDKVRVVSQVVGDGMFNFEYSLDTLNPGDSGKVTQFDPVSNETVFEYDGPIPVKLTRKTRGVRHGDPHGSDPAEYVTTLGIPEPGYFEPSSVTLPDGRIMTTTYTRNADDPRFRSHVRSTTVMSADSTTSVTTTYYYDFDETPAPAHVFGLVRTITDTRGYVTRLDYFEPGELGGTSMGGELKRITTPTATLYDHDGPTGGTQTLWEEFEYNQEGRLVLKRDSSGVEVAVLYYDSGMQEGRIQSIIIDPSGDQLTTTFKYDEVGNITTIIDPKGNRSEFVIDYRDLIIEAHGDISGYISRYDYTSSGYQQAEKRYDDQTGNWITTMYEYDRMGRITKLIQEVDDNPDHNIITKFVHDAAGQIEIMIQPEGNQIRYVYDERNLPYKMIAGEGLLEEAITTFYYNYSGNLLKLVDPEGKAWKSQYDNLGRRIGFEDPTGHRNEQVLDAAGFVKSHVWKDVSDTVLAQTNYYHDEVGRVYWKDQLLFDLHSGVVDKTIRTAFQFDPTTGKTAKVTYGDMAIGSPRISMIYEYDHLLRPLVHRDALGNQALFAYDDNSNLTSIKTTEDVGEADEGIYITEYAYDSHDRLYQRIRRDQAGTIVVSQSWTYDSRNNILTVTDAMGNTAHNQYDRMNRLVRIINDLRDGGIGSGAIVGTIEQVFTYDKNSQLISLTDGKGKTTTHVYDTLGRTIQTIHADGRAVSYDYYPDSKLRSRKDPIGSVTNYYYDAANRLVHRDFISGPGVAGTTFEYFTYDGLSRVKQATNDASQVEFIYDSLNREISSTLTFDYYKLISGEPVASGLDGHKGTTSLVYDGTSSLQELHYPGGRQVSFYRDELRRIETIRDGAYNPSPDPDTYLIGMSYKGPSLLETVARASNNGAQTVYGYDMIKRNTSISHKNGLLAEYLYVFDLMGNRLFEKRTHDSDLQGNYIYDSLYRLIKYERDDNGIAVGYTKEYQLDKVGNRKQVIEQGVPTIYLSLDTHAYNKIGDDERHHDENGNLKQADAKHYTFDAQNRLINAITPMHKVEYNYDALGRRIEKRVYDATVAQNGIIREVGSGHPFDTIQAALDDLDATQAGAAFQEDQIIRIHEGTYGPFVIPSTLNPCPTHTLYIKAAPGVSPLVLGTGPLLSGTPSHITIRGLKFQGTGDNITIEGGEEITIERCVFDLAPDARAIVAQNTHGLTISRIRLQGARGLLYASNTTHTVVENTEILHPSLYGIYLRDSTAPKVRHVTLKGGHYGIVLSGTSNAQVQNNIITDVTEVALFSRDMDATFDHNLVWNAANYSYWGDTAYNTLANFTATSGQGINSMETDPLFIKPTDGDLTLLLTSPAVGAGIHVGTMLDLEGVARDPNHVTLGADDPVAGITRFFYQGNEIIEEQSPIEKTFVTYLTDDGIDDLLSIRRDEIDYYYHTKALGTITQISDANGDLVEQYCYDDFGQIDIRSKDGNCIAYSSIGNPYMFTGRQFEPETALYYFRARYYDPKTGRFIGRDPTGIWGDSRNMGNGYTYCANNPTYYTDPLGLHPEEDLLRAFRDYAHTESPEATEKFERELDRRFPEDPEVRAKRERRLRDLRNKIRSLNPSSRHSQSATVNDIHRIMEKEDRIWRQRLKRAKIIGRRYGPAAIFITLLTLNSEVAEAKERVKNLSPKEAFADAAMDSLGITGIDEQRQAERDRFHRNVMEYAFSPRYAAVRAWDHQEEINRLATDFLFAQKKLSSVMAGLGIKPTTEDVINFMNSAKKRMRPLGPRPKPKSPKPKPVPTPQPKPKPARYETGGYEYGKPTKKVGRFRTNFH